jgi:hypothetical protein
MSDDHPTLMPADVAAMFGVEPCTVLGWCGDGKITGLKIGHRTLRLRPSDVARFIERHETKPAGAARG